MLRWPFHMQYTFLVVASSFVEASALAGWLLMFAGPSLPKNTFHSALALAEQVWERDKQPCYSQRGRAVSPQPLTAPWEGRKAAAHTGISNPHQSSAQVSLNRFHPASVSEPLLLGDSFRGGILITIKELALSSNVVQFSYKQLGQAKLCLERLAFKRINYT